ncbi:hypothetical protein M408DRAFT_330407 [Serendipita vermifera MAFF 305830]|uniref:Uncharacterized protein n=1 Tax=Serendipita vermifera MAFF 305830 TaxID=933852 RepID=A0A0C2XCB7_SERVB|nr:hypothetical protein M408DRAFT_330407 [Serendipita vermifera MAFF 305830]
MAEIIAGLCCGIPILVGIGAVTELIVLIIGHAILKLTGIPAYRDNTIVSTAQVGAVGGSLMALPILLTGAALFALLVGITRNLRVIMEGERAIVVILGLAFPLSAAAVGREILSHTNHSVMEHLDYIKAVFVGAAVLGAAFGVLAVMLLACGCACAITWGGWSLASLRPTRIPRGEREAKTLEDMEMRSSEEGSTTSEENPLSTILAILALSNARNSSEEGDRVS